MDSSRSSSAPAPLWAALVVALLLLAACTSGEDDPSAPSADATGTTEITSPAGTSEEETPAGEGEADVVKPDEVTVKDEEGHSTSRGKVPGWAELDEATVVGDVQELVFTVYLGSRAPRSIGDDETSRVTIGVLTEDGKRYSIYAQASQDGWAGYAVGGEEGPFPGDLDVSGRVVRVDMPRDYFGPPAPFRWLVNVAYARGNAYGFDSLPEKGYARFP